MLTRNMPLKVKFICGFIYRHEEIYNRVKSLMQDYFGIIDYESKVIPFDFTTYYNEEMGEPLFRKFVAFKNLKESEVFPQIKIRCIEIEKESAIRGKRVVNIDPGYITLAKLVLFTTKDFYHRLHIEKGVYAEVTLKYVKGHFEYFEWTYPDYRSDIYQNIFLKIRSIYKNQLNYKEQDTFK